MIQYLYQAFCVAVLLLSVLVLPRLPSPFRHLFLVLLFTVFFVAGAFQVVLLVLLLLSALFNLLQDRLIYRNTSKSKMNSFVEAAINCYLKRVEIKGEGVTLRGWQRVNEQDQVLVLFLHGIGGFNIRNKLKFIDKYCQETRAGFLIVAYRGYVNSTGTPSEEGIKADACAIMRYALSKNKRVIVHGKSLGGAVAVHIATHQQFKSKLKGLVLENTFTTFKEAACSLFPYFKPFILYQVLSQWRSIDTIAKVEVPTLMISSKEDKVIPARMMDQLFSALNSPKMFYRIQTGSHGHTWQKDPQGYFQKINEFLLLS